MRDGSGPLDEVGKPHAAKDPQAELRAQFIRVMRAHRRAREAAEAQGLVWSDPGYPRDPDMRPFVDLRCGATAKRARRPCQLTSIYQNGRCKFHGGLSTGPKTLEGKARASRNAGRRRTP